MSPCDELVGNSCRSNGAPRVKRILHPQKRTGRPVAHHRHDPSFEAGSSSLKRMHKSINRLALVRRATEQRWSSTRGGQTPTPCSEIGFVAQHQGSHAAPAASAVTGTENRAVPSFACSWWRQQGRPTLSSDGVEGMRELTKFAWQGELDEEMRMGAKSEEDKSGCWITKIKRTKKIFIFSLILVSSSFCLISLARGELENPIGSFMFGLHQAWYTRRLLGSPNWRRRATS